MELDLEKIVKTIKDSTDGKFEVFTTDMTKSEVDKNKSFLIYHPYGQITPGENYLQFKQSFTLSFITTEDIEFSPYVFTLAHKLNSCGLRFDGTTEDYGKIKDTDQEAKMVTISFHKTHKVERHGRV